MDVMIDFSVAGIHHKTIIEYKHYSHRVSKDVLRSVVYNMNKLRANGVIATTKGFQEGVIEAAKEDGVTLYQVNFREIFEQGQELVGKYNIIDKEMQIVSTLNELIEWTASANQGLEII
ncbi:restriction endonuclease [Providencia vermicola]|uniref:restriction endonuclease n=1 Tax=Providencia vermicola TaxID=333965 RepID=UPI0034E53C7C